ncbi:MAG TPA: adenylyl-sulfate kinase [Solirubrobacteraceae bacterium]|nr:adenylyl-sulfate kinase [Solirubrobacteraceae bacterium]
MNGHGAHAPGATVEAESSADVFRRLADRPVDLLRFATAGSVDDGKSTLIGRLLYDSKQVLADQLAHVEQASRRKGEGVLDLSLLTDGLRAEREQGITIDVAYRYFATAQRRFIIADTPGHEQYTRNMVTGASTADLAIVLVDARKGVLAQSKRHAFISSLLGIPHVVVCVNKMDLVDFQEEVFNEIVEEFDAFAARLEMPDVTFIPISALLGDNVVDRSESMPWYQGPPLLYHLEHVHIASDRNLIDVRFPVQWVIRPPATIDADYRAYAGQVAGGIMRPGDEVVVLPGGQRTTIADIDSYDGPVEEAFPPMSVAVRLTDDIDVGRGSTIVRTHNQPTVANRFEALVCWMSEQPLQPGRRYLVKHTTRTAMVGKVDVRYRIDVESLRRDEEVDTLSLNDLARVHLELSSPLVFDSYRRNRVTGSLIMIDEATNDTVAAGVILDTEVEEAPAPARSGTERSPNVRWQGTRTTRERRREALGHIGATLWFTGLPGAGKSTVAAAVEERLLQMGRPAFMLDGDNLRHGLNGDLGFDEAARAENVRRTAHVARLLAESGTVALVSLVSPYAADRRNAASLHETDELEFFEVFVDAPLEVCEQRDPKGLYARARAGELAGMTGVGAPYEPPTAADLTLGSSGETVEEEVERVLDLLRERGVI